MRRKQLLPRQDRNDNTSRNLGRIFKKERCKRNLSQLNLSEAANINNSYYCSVERGTVNLSLRKFLSICSGLRVSPEEVIRQLKFLNEESAHYGESNEKV